MNNVIDLVMQVQAVGLTCHPLNQRHKRIDGIGRPSVQVVAGDGARCAPQRTGVRAGIRTHHFDGARTDAACRLVDDPLKRTVVIAIRDQAQVRQRILDLGSLEKSQATVDAIRNTRVDKTLFQHA